METVRDPTFRNFDAANAIGYAQHRPSYSNKLIDVVISQHTSLGGKTDLLVDVGCGPGTATRSLSPYFRHVIGTDPSASMIEAARGIPSTTNIGETVNYELSPAEALSQLSALRKYTTESSSMECVDLITCATSAHWFDLPAFYAEAAKILKPGGNIIMWTSGRFYCDPYTTPNAREVLKAIDKFDTEIIEEYKLEGNKLCDGLYSDLRLPWDSSMHENKDQESRRLLGQFHREDFVRREFNKDGFVKPGDQFLWGNRISIEQAKKMLSTGSPIIRWREAHKDALLRGEIKDCVDEAFEEVAQSIEQDPEGTGRDWIDIGRAMIVLVIRKS